MGHFATVCVVCVLCTAAHIPCSAHRTSDPLIDPSGNYSTKTDGETLPPATPQASSYSRARSKHLDEEIVDEDLAYMQIAADDPARQRRHAHPHHHHAHPQLDDGYFVKKIFESYGDGKTMSMDGFEKMMEKLKLFQYVDGGHGMVNTHHGHDHDHNEHEGHSHVADDRNTAGNDSEGATTITSSNSACLGSRELLSALSHDRKYMQAVVGDSSNASTNNDQTLLPEWLFKRLCPALVFYQLSQLSSGDCLHVDGNLGSFGIDEYGTDENMSKNMFEVWMYSTVSIVIISLVGLLGVAVIPVIGKSFYNHLLQYLVALAIGTLCGDALIHLLPHAMSHHTHQSNNGQHLYDDQDLHDHNENMYKGFVAMVGLVVFFFIEKTLNIASEWRRLRKSGKQVSDKRSSNLTNEKLAKHKHNNYPYSYGEIAGETEAGNLHNLNHNHHEKSQNIEEEKPLTANCPKLSKVMPNDVEKRTGEDWKLDESNVKGGDLVLHENDGYPVNNEIKHCGHSHMHSHMHGTPDSLSNIAWMVVLGDGLHNFADGMAIGAAFASDIPGGFSTTIAVFCHELPHELGDFAVLLKAGMSAKQAVLYNMLSSILCLFGMIFGVMLGSQDQASSWMFAAAAGMFIYIALVDMVPELSTNNSIQRGAHWNYLLQALGLITGFSIMLIIALYEHDLAHIFQSSKSTKV